MERPDTSRSAQSAANFALLTLSCAFLRKKRKTEAAVLQYSWFFAPPDRAPEPIAQTGGKTWESFQPSKVNNLPTIFCVTPRHCFERLTEK